jgi:hypothetical protein
LLGGFVLQFSEICAGDPATGKGTCNGDSGGPLVTHDPTTGGHVLIGATSVGVGQTTCSTVLPTVFSLLGGDPLHAFVESLVPHVEIRSLPAVYATRPVEIVAFGNDPGGTGPLQGYDHLGWDLDADGAFDDATDVASVLQTFPKPGLVPVSVNASSAAGDSETRTVRLRVSAPSRVSFTKRVYHLRGTAKDPFFDFDVVRGPLHRFHSRAAIRGTARVTVTGHGRTKSTRIKEAHEHLSFGVAPKELNHGSYTVKLGDFTGGFAPGKLTTAKLSLKTR